MGVLMINDEPVGTTSDAKHTPFNPSGTDLTATNVEDAIKEVNGSDTYADDVIYDNSTTGLPANVQGAIDKTTGNISDNASIELTATAANAHAAGSMFLWIGQLVKVTAAIAVGDTISLNTNVSATNVAAVLSELNSNLNLLINKCVVLTGQTTATNYIVDVTLPLPSGWNTGSTYVVCATVEDSNNKWDIANTGLHVLVLSNNRGINVQSDGKPILGRYCNKPLRVIIYKQD